MKLTVGPALQQDPASFQPPPLTTPPPSWLPQPPAGYEPPQAAPSAPDFAGSALGQDQPPASTDGFSFDFGGWRITGWHAVAVIAAGLAALTLWSLYSFTSTTADVNAFDQAPICAGHDVAPGCKTHFLAVLTVSTGSGSSSSCFIRARPALAIHPGEDIYFGYGASFSKDACNSYSTGSHAEIELWKGSLVHLYGLTTDYWSDSSSEGIHLSAERYLVIYFLIDAIFVVLVALYYFSKLGRWFGRKRENPAA